MVNLDFSFICECEYADCEKTWPLTVDSDYIKIKAHKDLFPDDVSWFDRKTIYHPDCKHIPTDAIKIEEDGRTLGWVGS